MTNSTSMVNDTMTTAEKLRAYVPWVIAGIILIGYAWFINYLVGKTNAEDAEWTKVTYIFSSVEAVVFTAIGFIFGREVNKSRALKAEKAEEKEKRDKNELAKEVLKQLPTPPPSPQTFNFSTKDLSQLRNIASGYLKE